MFFRGNDRSPEDGATDLNRAISGLLGTVLPEVFDRFEEAAAKVSPKDVDALLTSDNLDGLPSAFMKLRLLKNQGGRTAIDIEQGPLAEVLSRIRNRAEYGGSASGRSLADELVKEPFGWEFDTVRLLVAALLRAGAIEVTSKGQIIDSAMTVEARAALTSNTAFRQATFRPKLGLDYLALISAAQAYEETFGRQVPELAQTPVATAIREAATEQEMPLREMHTMLVTHQLPGAQVLGATLDQLHAIRMGKEEPAILTFISSHAQIKDAVRRAADLRDALTEPALHTLSRARMALSQVWPFLRDEHNIDSALLHVAARLEDLLERETFYRDLPTIDQATTMLWQDCDRRACEALKCRQSAYMLALEHLTALPNWSRLDEEQQNRIAQPLARYVSDALEPRAVPIPQMRADVDACATRLAQAVEDVQRLTADKPIVRVSAARYFRDGIETEEELTAALDGLREEVEHLIGEDKKVLVVWERNG